MSLSHNSRHLAVDALALTRERPRPTNALAGRGITSDESQRVQQQLWHSQKLEALGCLATGIAHDFRNLLTVILGYCELLENHLKPGDPGRDFVEEIHKAGTLAEHLTRQITNFAGSKALEPQILDLGNVLKHTEKMLRRLIGNNILLSTMVPAQLWPVKMDRGQVQQIIVNLVVNARDAMPAGGTLTIQLANVVLEPTRCDEPTSPREKRRGEGAARHGNYVMLSVSDTGMGMSPATCARMFEPFFSTKPPGKGTGIGLAMVDEIVKQNGGHIDWNTEVGKGSTFNIFIPQAFESTPAEFSPAANGFMPQGNEVVLVVEDEQAVRNLVRQILHMCGYQVLEAMDGKEAIELAEKYEGSIHLLVSDVAMPHMDGCQLADTIRARHRQLKVLFLSGYTIDYVYEHGGRETEFAFLQKPFTVVALACKVREVLNQ